MLELGGLHPLNYIRMTYSMYRWLDKPRHLKEGKFWRSLDRFCVPVSKYGNN